MARFRSAGRQWSARSVTALAAFAIACSSESSNDTTGTGGDGLSIPPECRGFSFSGLKYSPGDDALPDKCKPFDPTTNNPFAVRCIDVMPGYKTRYPGDNYCVLPPPPDKGLQIGVHPQGAEYWQKMWAKDLSGYSDDTLTKDFELGPGGEVEQTYRATMDNDESRFYYRIDSRMRSGSHHMATYYTSTEGEDGWLPVDPSEPFVPMGAGGFFWNSQRSDTDRPAGSLAIPDEDLGVGLSVGVRQRLLFDLHHFNTRDAPILREVWVNIWWVDGPVSRAVEDEPLVAPVDVPPNSKTDLNGSFAPETETRILSLFGHRHAWTRRFNAWLHRSDGTDEPVYDSFDWLDVPTYSYDSLSKNPVANPDANQDGAASGVLTVRPGDELRFTCHVDTTPEHALELGVAAPTENLVFGNKAFDAEMCILYAQTIPMGSADGGSAPARDL
jgi:hypothetical protein